MNFNCQDFIFNIALIQTVSLQIDFPFSHVCVHACDCVSGGRFVSVAVIFFFFFLKF